jgi:hypothetical protein
MSAHERYEEPIKEEQREERCEEQTREATHTNTPQPALILTGEGIPAQSGVYQIPNMYAWLCVFHTRDGLVQFNAANGDILFLLEPRPLQYIVYMNARINGEWGPHEQIYIPTTSNNYIVTVSVTAEGFAVIDNGVQVKLFPHRADWRSFAWASYTAIDPIVRQSHHATVNPNDECCLLM